MFAGAALAGDPAPQSAPSGTSLKVGIDANGNLRPLTAEESAALDAEAAANGGNGARARSLRATATATSTTSRARFPSTEAEALATAVTVDGITMMKPTLDSVGSVTVQRNADGSLTFAENGEVSAPSKRESASE